MTDTKRPRSDEPEELPELDLAQEQRLLELLLAALRPTPLDPAGHERILADALEDPLTPPTAEELSEAAALRQALETGAGQSAADLARALAHARGKPADERAVVERALERALPTRPNLVFVAFGAAATALALAAGVMLVMRPLSRPSSAAPHLSLARSRSLSPLVATDGTKLTATERMDRMATLRARELRENRYKQWGVP